MSFPFLRYELTPPLCDPLRDLLVPAPEERADGNAQGGLVREPGLKGRRAVPRFVARHLHARRGTEEIGKPRLSQMRVAAITAKVVIKWPSVNVFHGSTKKRRLAGSSVESGYVSGRFSARQTNGRKRGRADNSRAENELTFILHFNIAVVSRLQVRAIQLLSLTSSQKYEKPPRPERWGR